MTGFTPELVERCAKVMRPVLFGGIIGRNQDFEPERERARMKARLVLEASGIAELTEALRLHVAYEAMPADRGGKDGPKGRAWSAFIEARNAALAKHGGMS